MSIFPYEFHLCSVCFWTLPYSIDLYVLYLYKYQIVLKLVSFLPFYILVLLFLTILGSLHTNLKISLSTPPPPKKGLLQKMDILSNVEFPSP